jgi:F-type H+-transporting ATPase subunit b
MLIDWFTVGAQLLNFVLLVWLLKHFLYGPILAAIDAREARIAKELSDAKAEEAEAAKERTTLRQKNEEFDRQRSALLAKADADAQAAGAKLLDSARQAADDLAAKRQRALRNDSDNLKQEIGRRTQQEVFAIARKVLGELAGVAIEQRACELFIGRLRALEGPKKEELGAGLRSATTPALVRTAFDLPEVQRASIRNAINEAFAADIALRFETAPDLVSGVEISSSGHKLSWSIAGCLASMQDGVEKLLRDEDRPDAA